MCEPTAAKFIGATLGIDAATEVVVYDAGAGANASGAWFFLKLYGAKNVRILDGGLATWKAHGGAVEQGAPAKVAAKTFTPAVQWKMIATLDEVKKATADSGHYLLLDSRHNLDEFTGKTLSNALASPGKEITVKRGGAIPTAVFSPWSKYAGNKDGQPDKPTLKGQEDLQKQLEKLKKNGYDPSKTVISYCAVGLGRGSFQYLALQKAGHENVKVVHRLLGRVGQRPLPPGRRPALTDPRRDGRARILAGRPDRRRFRRRALQGGSHALLAGHGHAHAP